MSATARAACLMRVDSVDQHAHDLGDELRSDAPAPRIVGQSAGLLLRAAYELYDELQGSVLADCGADSLRRLIARGVGGV